MIRTLAVGIAITMTATAAVKVEKTAYAGWPNCYRITNGEVKLMGPWALTMMAQGGVGITGFPPRGVHPRDLDPTNPLTMWAYTDFSDKRWKFTKKYLTLTQDPKATTAQKTGLFNEKTFGAYLLGSDLYIKRYAAEKGKNYPDYGVSFETFTNNEFLELET